MATDDWKVLPLTDIFRIHLMKWMVFLYCTMHWLATHDGIISPVSMKQRKLAVTFRQHQYNVYISFIILNIRIKNHIRNQIDFCFSSVQCLRFREISSKFTHIVVWVSLLEWNVLTDMMTNSAGFWSFVIFLVGSTAKSLTISSAWYGHSLLKPNASFSEYRHMMLIPYLQTWLAWTDRCD